MIVRLKKSFKVADLQINEDYAKVTCQINSKLRNYVQVGESITIDEDFDMNFGGFNSKWKIIFYPKGQYDFGVPSNDCRIYLKLISCEKSEVKMKIITYLISTVSNQTSTVRSTGSCEHLFVTNNNLRNWAGPFSMQLLNDSIDSLRIKCTFRLVSNVKDSKRGLSEVDSSPKDNQLLNLNSSKKSRCVSPSVQGFRKQICSPMEVDVALTPNPLATESPQLFSPADPLYMDPPNPFISKSPLLYTRLTQYRTSSESSADKFVNSQRGDFQFRKPLRRSLIYTPNERDEIRNHRSSCGTSEALDKMSLNQCNVSSNQNVQSTRFKSSGCLKLSDIESVEETGQSGTEETSTSDSAATVSGDGESNHQATFKDKVRFHQDNFK